MAPKKAQKNPFKNLTEQLTVLTVAHPCSPKIYYFPLIVVLFSRDNQRP